MSFDGLTSKYQLITVPLGPPPAFYNSKIGVVTASPIWGMGV